MATITLYKEKVNGVGGLIDNLIKSSSNLDVQLGTLKNTLQISLPLKLAAPFFFLSSIK